MSLMAYLGKGVEYALHSLLSLIKTPEDSPLGVSDIAEFQGVSPSYLSKIFTRLKKAGIVRFSIGVKGGYVLAKPPDQITFWDVVVAVEGEFSLFECRNIREKIAIYKEGCLNPDWQSRGPCTIHKAMMDVETQIRNSLKEKNIAWLRKVVDQKLSQEEKNSAIQWFNQMLEDRK
uniref:Transcriptional regulator, BadM/Rrf2 family n=1 Tax=Leptospirillum ferrodiazotrophum TaxID=412449 RepID=C6HU70_9BACT|nr:MAG: transcriptional regulator, BadM/Rrf2 family [Leptospirillum ferrodiazotrophum]